MTGKFLIVAAAALSLTGCLWGPGKFASDLALRKDGTFVLAYRGEMLLQMPEDKERTAEPWSDNMARCYADGRADLLTAIAGGTQVTEEPPPGGKDQVRPCKPAEISRLKTQYEKQAAEAAAQQRKESDNVARMLGLPGADDESNRRFAASLAKYQGWRAVTYKGKGVFDVDYRFEGRVGQDFVFPVMPESDLIIPFVTIRRRQDGAVMVAAPALTGGSGPFSARARMLNLPGKDDGPRSRAEGRFTITTDGDILTNNSEDGPVAGPTGRQVRWDVSPASTKIPEMLVRL